MLLDAPSLKRPLRAALDEVGNDWRALLQDFADSATGRALCKAVDARVAASSGTDVQVYPPDPFLALKLTPLHRVRVLVLGQDPYHGPGQAEGLAFSVATGTSWPPSLRNILAEWQRDLGPAQTGPLPCSGSLRPWAHQGVLLLNTSLTVESGQPGSHSKLGWHALTSAITAAVLASRQPTAVLQWGAHAQAVVAAIGTSKVGSASVGTQHAMLACNHPSPLSARRGPVPFVGCCHFSRASRFLAAAGRGPLDWSLG